MMYFQTLRAGLGTAALVALVSVPLGAQRLPMNYSVITFRKVAPEKVDAFLAFTRDQTKKVIQARIDTGGIKNWSLLKLTSPYSMDSDYNYVTVTFSEKFPDLDPSATEMDAVYKKAGVNRVEYAKTSRELSKIVHQTINRGVMRVGGGTQVGDFVRVDYHVTPADRPGELIEMEESVWAPIFKDLVAADKGLRAWAVGVPVFPTGTESGYNFFTTQTFKDSASVGAGAGASPDVFRKVHPDRNYQNTIQHMRAIDRIDKVRIYHVLDVLGAPILATQVK